MTSTVESAYYWVGRHNLTRVEVLNPSRDKHARDVPSWGGGRRAYCVALILVTTKRKQGKNGEDTKWEKKNRKTWGMMYLVSELQCKESFDTGVA